MACTVAKLVRHVVQDRRILTWRFVADEYNMKKRAASKALEDVLESLRTAQNQPQEGSHVCITFTTKKDWTVLSRLWVCPLTEMGSRFPPTQFLQEQFGSTQFLHNEGGQLLIESIAILPEALLGTTTIELERMEEAELTRLCTLFDHAMNLNQLYVPRHPHSMKIKASRRVPNPSLQNELTGDTHPTPPPNQPPPTNRSPPSTDSGIHTEVKQTASPSPLQTTTQSTESTEKKSPEKTAAIKKTSSKLKAPTTAPLQPHPIDPHTPNDQPPAKLRKVKIDPPQSTQQPQPTSRQEQERPKQLLFADEDIPVDKENLKMVKDTIYEPKLVEEGEGLVYRKIAKEVIKWVPVSNEKPQGTEPKKRETAKRQHSQMGLESFFSK
eukprot:Protomagalhaensia_sp_Gyna_25__3055@NODE_280_length_4063_cov_674_606859_g215_i0_p2_GENE_NODE_280_length_4063_cov_674_606859_g215_i0NODE_280_length_4063_cov_674_606859_g215_i0_p2_ORF_typecomplete_len382_score79_56_NODE_280_length_4063_cov_674_606859_g215_i016172762